MTQAQEKIDNQIIEAEKAFSEHAYDKAIAILSAIIRNYPEYTSAYRKLAAIHLRTKTPETALPLINKTLDLAADDAENWKMLGHYYVRLKIWNKALDAFYKALKFSDDNVFPVQYEIFKIYRSSNDTEKALELIESISRDCPQNFAYLWDHAKLLHQIQQNSKALDIYNELLNRPIEQLPAVLLVEWQKLMVEQEHTDELLQWLKEQSTKYPENVILKWLHGASCTDAGQYEKAIELLKNVHKINPDLLPNTYALAYALYLKGEKDEALFYADEYLNKSPNNAEALLLSTTLQKVTHNSKIYKQLNEASDLLPSLPREDRTKLYYALAKANDDVGDYAQAFIDYKKGGTVHSAGRSDDLRTQTVLRDVYFKFFDKNMLNSLNSKGYYDKSSVFIVGMPRSGTTLMEKVISSIDGIYAAGELPYLSRVLDGFIIGNKKLNTLDKVSKTDDTWSLEERGRYYVEQSKSLAPEGTKKIIDKMPSNFSFLGPLHLILPEASIIHSRRHPAEICLSAYRLSFKKGLYWSDDLRTLGKYYRIYHEMMEHWKHVLPKGTILEVRYEDMVNDLEGQSKRIAKHIGVEWDPACLEFHNNKKSVKTASALQVNQPLYKSSMNRWKKYEKYLQPLIDEIGDLIEAYETELNNQ